MVTLPPILEKIRLEKEREIHRLYASGKTARYEKEALAHPSDRDFRAAISQQGFNMIAEFKKASPSEGIIRPYARPETIARLYEECGAVAISVLTDFPNFRGRLEFLKRIRETVGLPILRKDFILDRHQIYEARAWGADAVLLIASMLEPIEIRGLINAANSVNMDCLVESHDEEDLEKAIAGGATILGINNRNLHQLRNDRKGIDLDTTRKLLGRISDPEKYTIITESGINTPEDLRKVRLPEVNGYLIGTRLTSKKLNPTLDDIKRTIRELQTA